MPYLNPETPEEEKKALSLAIKRQKHCITKTMVPTQNILHFC